MLLIVLGTIITAMVIGVSLQSSTEKAGDIGQPEQVTTQEVQTSI